ncbi:hypothetical protein [Chromohalobacter israelensis]|uniref:Uncharacterized protein n=1 Tax=Chromohalobacter israelensis (strain ATCC BAA-138 / DSM 3043 / CIP 106854 / NCIMB 13768 / 1H11) TaxID=290398 RepID=Q1QXS3_CHRI1|nr:hypothetical protein [Chromohalobacter salexigens]ABE58735.1 hypothetical protein Csal_1380 [Chromohalobacter salexigens DSM 3043]
MTEEEFSKLIDEIEIGVKRRYQISVILYFLLAISAIVAVMDSLHLGKVDWKFVAQVGGTFAIGVGIAVGLLTSKASALMTPGMMGDGRISAIRERYYKRVSFIGELAVLSTLVGTLASGLAPFM